MTFLLRQSVEEGARMAQNRVMDKSYVIETLRYHQPELKAAGIVHLRVFGSVARGNATPQSDIDLIADFDMAKRYTLLTMSRLENRLTDILGAKVDLSPSDSLKETVRREAMREAVLAF